MMPAQSKAYGPYSLTGRVQRMEMTYAPKLEQTETPMLDESKPWAHKVVWSHSETEDWSLHRLIVWRSTWSPRKSRHLLQNPWMTFDNWPSKTYVMQLATSFVQALNSFYSTYSAITYLVKLQTATYLLVQHQQCCLQSCNRKHSKNSLIVMIATLIQWRVSKTIAVGPVDKNGKDRNVHAMDWARKHIKAKLESQSHHTCLEPSPSPWYKTQTASRTIVAECPKIVPVEVIQVMKKTKKVCRFRVNLPSRTSHLQTSSPILTPLETMIHRATVRKTTGPGR